MHIFSRSRLTAVWAWALAFAVTALAGATWTGLLSLNLSTTPAIPWSVVVMGLLLWALYRYLGGAWAPHSTSDARRRLLRANRAPANVFGWAVAAGLLAIVALAGLWVVLFHAAGLPSRVLPDYSRYPIFTVALAVVMAALVNGVVEESLFRGYLQGILEGQVGGLVAIVITAVVMSPEHSLTQGFVWPTIVFYLLVDFMLGMSALLCQSILPGIVTHSVGIFVFFTAVWPGDLLRQTFGQGDATAWLWIHSGQALLFGALSVLAYTRLARLTQPSQTPMRRSIASA
ncbi:MAG TPA: CPBP family intramembrane glutamic endopeptidase [Ktedonobacterales bacterium]